MMRKRRIFKVLEEIPKKTPRNKRKIIVKIDENTPKKVGIFYESTAKPFSYFQVTYDENKWADSSKFLPADFDLCYGKLENGKIVSCWHSRNHWDGYRLKDSNNILAWKMNYME